MTEWHISLGRVKEDTAHVVSAKTFNTSQLEIEEVEDQIDDALRSIVKEDRKRVKLLEVEQVEVK